MYKILAILQVRDFQALDEFERQVSSVMSDYDGRIISAFETNRNRDGSGEEVHIAEFRNKEDFENYKNDSRHLNLKALRGKAISGTEIKAGLSEKSYGNESSN